MEASMLNGRKTVGIILFDITGYYQETIVNNLSKKCRDQGYNLLVFSAFTIYGYDSNNAKGEYNILHLIPYEQLDALILCQDTFNSNSAVEELWQFITTRVIAPVISMRKKINGCYNILVDDTNSIPAMVHHFHEVHHFERIAFFSGPYFHPDAIFRLEKYKETMKELNLPYPEEYIFEGDFWKDRAIDAVAHFMDLPKPPQAIVCANDYMALSLCKELTLQGYSVPQDVAISGFDNVQDSAANVPPLSTCSVSLEDMSSLAFDTLQRLLSGQSVERCRYVEAPPVIRNSCGCDIIPMRDFSLSRMYQVQQMESLVNHNVHNTFASISLQNLTTADEIGDYLKIEDAPNNARDFYLCLGKHGSGPYPQVKIKDPGFAKHSHSIYSLKDLKPIETSDFETKDLLPPEAIREEAMCVYFFPVHYLNYNFGYIAATSNGEPSDDTLFHTWISLIGNTLENIRIRKKNEALLKKLNTLYNQDFLTKLYNRRGFEHFSEEEFRRAQAEHVSSMILCIDMDCLKYINDVHGHSQGDHALQTIAKAMQEACFDDEICARIGGDEFSVFGYGYTSKEADEYITRFQTYLSDFNMTSELPYVVNASLGYAISDPDSSLSREYYMKLGDDILYQNKRKRKEKFGNNLSMRTPGNAEDTN